MSDPADTRAHDDPGAWTGAGSAYFPSIVTTYGRSITAWKQTIRAVPGYGAGTRHGELVAVLKTEHSMGHGHANALVKHTLDEDRAADA